MGRMNRRDATALGDPPEHPVPVPTVPAPRFAWRAHTDRPGLGDRGAWWYASGPDGRFNLSQPWGTCYLASDPQTALRERLGPRLVAVGYVRSGDITDVLVSQLRVKRASPLADTLAVTAVRVAHLTREISTVTDYQLTRRWAEFFRRCRCSGIRYAARHTTGQDAMSYALFGRAGARTTPPSASVPARLVAGVPIVTDAPATRDVPRAVPPNP